MGEEAAGGADPGVAADAELARDEADEDVGQDAGHVEHDERQDQPVLGPRRQEALRLAPRPPVRAQPQRVAAVPAGWELREGGLICLVFFYFVMWSESWHRREQEMDRWMGGSAGCMNTTEKARGMLWDGRV